MNFVRSHFLLKGSEGYSNVAIINEVLTVLSLREQKQKL
jgi:hypothetical protein